MDHSPSSRALASPPASPSPLQPKEIFPEVQQDAQTQSCHKTPPWNKGSPLHAEREKDIGSKQCQCQRLDLKLSLVKSYVPVGYTWQHH